MAWPMAERRFLPTPKSLNFKKSVIEWLFLCFYLVVYLKTWKEIKVFQKSGLKYSQSPLNGWKNLSFHLSSSTKLTSRILVIFCRKTCTFKTRKCIKIYKCMLYTHANEKIKRKKKINIIIEISILLYAKRRHDYLNEPQCDYERFMEIQIKLHISLFSSFIFVLMLI